MFTGHNVNIAYDKIKKIKEHLDNIKIPETGINNLNQLEKSFADDILNKTKSFAKDNQYDIFKLPIESNTPYNEFQLPSEAQQQTKIIIKEYKDAINKKETSKKTTNIFSQNILQLDIPFLSDRWGNDNDVIISGLTAIIDKDKNIDGDGKIKKELNKITATIKYANKMAEYEFDKPNDIVFNLTYASVDPTYVDIIKTINNLKKVLKDLYSIYEPDIYRLKQDTANQIDKLNKEYFVLSSVYEKKEKDLLESVTNKTNEINILEKSLRETEVLLQLEQNKLDKSQKLDAINTLLLKNVPNSINMSLKKIYELIITADQVRKYTLDVYEGDLNELSNSMSPDSKREYNRIITPHHTMNKQKLLLADARTSANAQKLQQLYTQYNELYGNFANKTNGLINTKIAELNKPDIIYILKENPSYIITNGGSNEGEITQNIAKITIDIASIKKKIDAAKVNIITSRDNYEVYKKKYTNDDQETKIKISTAITTFNKQLEETVDKILSGKSKKDIIGLKKELIHLKNELKTRTQIQMKLNINLNNVTQILQQAKNRAIHINGQKLRCLKKIYNTVDILQEQNMLEIKKHEMLLQEGGVSQNVSTALELNKHLNKIMTSLYKNRTQDGQDIDIVRYKIMFARYENEVPIIKFIIFICTMLIKINNNEFKPLLTLDGEYIEYIQQKVNDFKSKNNNSQYKIILGRAERCCNKLIKIMATDNNNIINLQLSKKQLDLLLIMYIATL